MRRFLVVLAISCAIALPSAAQNAAHPYEAAYKRIDALAHRLMREDNTPGMTLAITNRNGLLRLSTYGFAN